MSGKSFSFRLSAAGWDAYTAQLKAAVGEGEKFDALMQALVRTSPQLASAADTAAERLTKVAGALKEAHEHGGNVTEIFAKLGEHLASNTGMLGQFGTAFATGGGIGLGIAAFGKVTEGLKELIVAIPEAGDKFVLMNAQLTAITGTADLGAKAWELLAESAAHTGISVQSSLVAFSKLSSTTQELGTTTKQVADLVRGVQEIGIMSGTSAGNVDTVITALGRSLASGEVDARALRVLIGEMPMLARNLAQELGVGVGQLREMSKAGQLSSDVVLPALLRVSEKANQNFAEMPITIGRAKGELAHQTEEFLVSLDRGLGLSQKIANTLLGAAHAIHAIALPNERELADNAVAAARENLKNAEEGGGILGSPNARGASQSRIDAAHAQLAEALAHQRDLRQQARETDRAEAADAGNAARLAQRTRLKDEAETLRLGLDQQFKIEQDYRKRVEGLKKQHEGGAINDAEFDDLMRKSAEARQKALDGLVKHDDSASMQEDLQRKLESFREKIVTDATAVEDALNPAAAAMKKYRLEIEQLAKAGDLFNSGDPNGFSPEKIAELTEKAGDQLHKTLTDIERKGDSAAASFDKFFDRGISGFEDMISKGKSFSDILKGLETDIARLIIRASITGPLTSALDKSGGISGLVGPLFKAGLRYFFPGSDAPLTSSTGANTTFLADGGVMTDRGPVPLNRYAGGGVAYNPQMALYGEGSMPEAFVPLPDGRRIPVSMKGGGSVRGGDVHVHVYGSNIGPQQIAQAVQLAVAQSQAQLLASVNRGGQAAKEFGRRH